ncbi:uncharacterized protein LOC130654100 [Hydractinia symbiolongicarpus]|uniref:uncharacterized protein LOC130654100 n=1 Tax=Hydractinia symbiolongicarpus TaxID=13093 RepID=UPI00254BF844|nr:uncharacterized protein LOC130654100 [Hydractinia symbiolongicarpus]
MFGSNFDWDTDSTQDILNEKLFGKNSSGVIEQSHDKKTAKLKRKHNTSATMENEKKSRKKEKHVEVLNDVDPVYRVKNCPSEENTAKHEELASKEKRKKKKKKKKMSMVPLDNDLQETKVEKLDTKQDIVSSESNVKIQNNGVTLKTLNHNEHLKKKSKKTKSKKVEQEVNNIIVSQHTSHADKPVLKQDESNTDRSFHQFQKSSQNKKYSKFQAKLNRQLEGGHFRWINEKLYTSKSVDANDMFQSDPKLFEVYHKGFVAQVQHWPQNPVEVLINQIREREQVLVVADFGCGDAKIAQSVPNKVHSFDLVAVNKNVTACDMRKVPLKSNCVDIAVFCLSLMGTNIVDFLLEAKRVLKNRGSLLIAEVKSRFEDIKTFLSDVTSLGFTLKEKEESNKMFVILQFENSGDVINKNLTISLKPCIYKRR